MNIEDFLPKYPNIDESKDQILNPYTENFNNVIFHKKEFYDNRLSEVPEEIPTERGVLLKHQMTIARYLSSYTPYDRLLIVHSMGIGKTCAVIGAIEQIKTEDSNFAGALILAKGHTVLNNFITELVERCTPGQYIPADYSKLTKLEKIHRINKTTKFYSTGTFAVFGKQIKELSDSDIVQKYSNRIIVIDEVHNLRIQKDSANEKITLETYNQFHRFLHLVKNCKVILLSGTPMKDMPEEIAGVVNLILDIPENVPTGEEFKRQYMREEDNSYKLTPEKAEELKKKLIGKVSFLRTEPVIDKIFLGQQNIGSLKHLTVLPLKMSRFQTDSYRRASEMKQELDLDRREASLFVFPDGSYGKDGFNSFIESKKNKTISKDSEGQVSSFKLKSGMVESLKGSTQEETIVNIRKYSATYAAVLEKILQTDGNCFIYCSLVRGSGCILFSLLLELLGFSKANGSEKDQRPRYAILTSETASDSDIKNIKARYNQPDNSTGKFIKVVIGSRTVSESFSLKNVIFEAILGPWWNYSETEQAIARGIRIGSHKDLVDPKIEIMQPVAIPKDKDLKSVDLYMYETSEDKDISIKNIMRMLMEAAFDCSLNYLRNYVNGRTGSRECDYTSCNYNCYGVDMNDVRSGLDPKDLDYSTYQLYYSNPKVPRIRKRIEQIFRENYNTNLESIMKNLKGDFTEEEITNALHLISEASGGTEFDYETFLKLYSRTPVKKIINSIEKMFRKNFRMDLKYISTKFPENTTFEIITALQTIINDNIVLTNKYGFPSYLREEKNIYFLVNSMSVKSDFYTEYYNKFPSIQSSSGYEDATNKIYSSSLPKLIKDISDNVESKEFQKLVKTLPIKVQELFIEASISAYNKNIKNPISEKTMELFKSYIRKIGNTWVSTFLASNGQQVLRCNKKNVWTDCSDRYTELIRTQDEEKQVKQRTENPYGIMGKYNPENGAFCIVDFRKEKETIQKIATIRPNSADDDKRLKVSGRVCATIKVQDLIRLAAGVLKIPAPEGFREGDNRSKLLQKITGSSRYNIFTEEELNRSTDDDLRRIIYWISGKEEGGIRGGKTMCVVIKDWLDKNGFLEIDNQCGVQGKNKKVAVEKTKVADQVFRLEVFIPTGQQELFKAHFSDISKLMADCFNIKKYKPELNDDLWIIAFSKKKMVAFVTLDRNDVIKNVCVAQNYRRRSNIAINVMSQINKYICKTRKAPVILVDNLLTDYKRLIRMYESFGFEVQERTDKTTKMIHKCPV
jgi:hypothetical protein